MRVRPLSLLKVIAVGLGLGAAGLAPASAGVLGADPIAFTYDPAAVGISTQGPFRALGFTIEDFASIIFPKNPAPVGSIKESGFLLISSFQSGGAHVGNVNTPGAAGWGMYEKFTATSNGVGTGANFTGAFDKITATVFGYKTVKGIASVTFAGGVPQLHLPVGVNCVALTNCVKLATETGPISGSPNNANITNGVPNANVDTLFVPNPAEAGFFVKPNALTSLDLDQAFTNEPGAIKTHACASPCSIIIEIGGTGFSGGGDGSFIPEPASLVLFGVGLFTLGLVRRRRT